MEERHNLGTPSLPSGYHAQTVSSFRDASGRSYELHHVYGRSEELGDRGTVCRIDENLSFWSLTSSTHGEDRWLSYAAARMLRTPPMSFERFSSVGKMHGELPGLLHVGESPILVKPSA